MDNVLKDNRHPPGSRLAERVCHPPDLSTARAEQQSKSDRDEDTRILEGGVRLHPHSRLQDFETLSNRIDAY